MLSRIPFYAARSAEFPLVRHKKVLVFHLEKRIPLRKFRTEKLSGSPEFHPAPAERGLGALLPCLEALPASHAPVVYRRFQLQNCLPRHARAILQPSGCGRNSQCKELKRVSSWSNSISFSHQSRPPICGNATSFASEGSDGISQRKRIVAVKAPRHCAATKPGQRVPFLDIRRRKASMRRLTVERYRYQRAKKTHFLVSKFPFHVASYH